MEFIVPLLIVLAVVVLVVVVARAVGRKGRGSLGTGRPDSGDGGAQSDEATRELAVASSAKLTEEQHRAVYSLIARQNPLGAVNAYKEATGCGYRDAALAVAALSRFPQPTPEPVWMAEAAAEPPAPVSTEPAVPVSEGFLPEPEASALAPAVAEPAAVAPVVRGYRFRAIIAHGDDMAEIVSTRLNEGIVDQVKAMALAGDRDGAAQLLLRHSEATLAEAAAFVDLIRPEIHPEA